MNERIRLLAEQATEIVANKRTLADGQIERTWRPEYFNQVFAKLIVEECMNQVREQYVPVLEDELMMQDTHWDGYVQCGVDSVVGIREYFFGIEE